MQYRETDFNFVSRLMEHEGIYYYVRHTDGHNTLVLTDSTSKHTTAPGYEKISFIAPEHGRAAGARAHQQLGLLARDPARRLRARRLRSRAAERRAAGRARRCRAATRRATTRSTTTPATTCRRRDGEQYARVRIDELGTQFETAQAVDQRQGDRRRVAVHARGLPARRSEPRVPGAGGELRPGVQRLRGAAARAAAPTTAAAFVAMSSQQQFRPRRSTPKPFVQGPQTAVVVGPAGEEIYTDKYGRVKVQFHWDRYGKKDENSSCWIRVSQPWAGKGWGVVSTPRIGQEVIVDFLEGDPDQPIITGRVYNAEQQPPFGFPAGAVLSGIKSQTHKGAGYNEMSMDDTAGKEKITIHGQYDMDTHDRARPDADGAQQPHRHDRRRRFGDVGGNQTLHVGVNQTITIDANRRNQSAAPRRSPSPGTAPKGERRRNGDRRPVAARHRHRDPVDDRVDSRDAHRRCRPRRTPSAVGEAVTVGGAQAITVGGVQAITVGGAQAMTVGGMQAITVGGAQVTKVGALQSTTVGGDTQAVGGRDQRDIDRGRSSIKAAANYLIEAPTIVLKAGGSQIIDRFRRHDDQGRKVIARPTAPSRSTAAAGIKVKGPSIGDELSHAESWTHRSSDDGGRRSSRRRRRSHAASPIARCRPGRDDDRFQVRVERPARRSPRAPSDDDLRR